jgi:hypothetical protein
MIKLTNKRSVFRGDQMKEDIEIDWEIEHQVFLEIFGSGEDD